jgi:hypothetical protein
MEMNFIIACGRRVSIAKSRTISCSYRFGAARHKSPSFIDHRIMADVEPQTAVEPTIQGPEKAELLLRLDELLEAYLNTLDRYQKARQQLSTQLSSVSCLRSYAFTTSMPGLLILASAHRVSCL